MALIKCTECGHEVSDKASACPNCGCPIENKSLCHDCGQPIPNGVDVCPNCGCPIEDNIEQINYKSKNSNAIVWILISLLVCLILGGGYYVYNLKTNSIANGVNEEITTDSVQSKDVVADNVSDTSQREQNPKKNNQETVSLSRFVGTYWLDFGLLAERFHNNPIVVLEDGRCLIVYETVSGSKDAQMLGEIRPLSNNAFSIRGRESSFGPHLYYSYTDSEGNEHKYTISVKSDDWVNYDPPVFDLNEMKVYRRNSEYQNRDVATAYYTDIKSKTSSTSLTQ